MRAENNIWQHLYCKTPSLFIIQTDLLVITGNIVQNCKIPFFSYEQSRNKNSKMKISRYASYGAIEHGRTTLPVVACVIFRNLFVLIGSVYH